MKKIIFACFVFSTTVMAQDTEFSGSAKWSELFAVTKKVLSPDIIGQDGSFIYLSRFIKGDRYLEKYNLSTLTLEKSVEIELTYNEKDLKLMDQFMFGGKPTLLTSFYNSKLKKSFLFLQNINPSSLAISEPVNIASMDGGSVRIGLWGSAMMDAAILASASKSVYISENQEFGFVMIPEYNDKDDKGKPAFSGYSASLIESDLEIVAKNSMKMPYDNFISVATRVSNSGDVYMLGYERVVDEDAKKGLFQGTKMKMGNIHIVVLNVESGDMETVDIAVEGRDIEMLTFDLTDDDQVNVAGLLSAEGTGVNGSFFIKFDEALTEISNEHHDFETDFITTGWSEKKKEDLEKKQDKGKKDSDPQLYNYYIDHLITKPDGSCLMLAEQFYIRVVTTTTTSASGGTVTRTTYYYYYNDIIAINYDKNGDFSWKQLIRKQQMSVNDGGYYSSYLTVAENNDVHVIYNDRESNYVDTEGMSSSEIKALKRSTIGACVTLSSEGEQSKQKLFEFEEGGLRLVPKVCSEAGDGIVFLYARSLRGDKIGAIDFN